MFLFTTKCPYCKRKIKKEDRACPYCGTRIGDESRIPKLNSSKKTGEIIKKSKDNPRLGLLVQASKSIFVQAVSWLIFFLALMLLAYILF
ncbi:MAG: zinc ribbon domain-containing protein [Lachnospiraceae bacterium]|nr:zinc ribbon domain-containing protein [Lachnospiraceae bacterium]